MAFVIDESFLPARLTAPPMTDEQFVGFCNEHPDFRFEINAEGEVLVLSEADEKTSARNSRVTAALAIWAEEDGRGSAFDSCMGFVLPNGATRSPDAAWIPQERLDPSDEHTFLSICPDFVIELKSPSDRLPELREKMREWIANGSQFGWLINPESKTVEIYRPGQAPELLTDSPSVTGEGPLAGFVLPLGPRLWEPFRR